MAQSSVQLRCAGLWLLPNKLSSIPPGALKTADNIVINRDNIAEVRRGFKVYGTTLAPSTERAKQLLVYKNRIIRHYSTFLEYDSDAAGTFLRFKDINESDISISEVSIGLRIKGLEANGNFYITSSTGIRKISALSATDILYKRVTDAGGIKALDVELALTGSSGFFTNNTQVAYRVVWGITDNNNNLILGSPSTRAVITNTAGGARSVNVTFPIPQGITVDHFYQIYRTALSGDQNTDPGDEMNLVYEDNPSTADIAAGTLTVNDTYPEVLRVNAAPLYTNEISGDGILQANDAPPISKDLALFKQRVFYANTQTKFKKDLTLLAADYDLMGTKFIIGNSSTFSESTYTFSVPEVSRIVCNAASTLPAAGTGAFFDIDSGNDGSVKLYRIWYDVANGNTAPAAGDRILVEVDVGAGDTATQVAAATVADFNAITVTTPGDAFVAYNDGATVNVRSFSSGLCTDIVDGSTATGFTFSVIQQGTWESIGSKIIAVYNQSASPATNIDNTARSLVKVINRQSAERLYAFYLSGSSSLPGQILFEDRSLNSIGFYLRTNTPNLTDQTFASGDVNTGTEQITVTAHNLKTDDPIQFTTTTTLPGGLSTNFTYYAIRVDANTIQVALTPGGSAINLTSGGSGTHTLVKLYAGTKYNSTLPGPKRISAASIANPTVVTSASHGLVSNQTIYIQSSNSTPVIDGSRVVTVLTTNTFTVPVNVTVAGTFGEWWYSELAADNEVKPNRVYFSKISQPEAVPIVNYLDIGSNDKEILRIISLRDSLFALKEDGIFRINEAGFNAFGSSLFDPTITIKAADSAVVLNNQIHCFSSEGVTQISDTGVATTSRPIDNVLIPLSLMTNFSTATWAVAYDTDKSYLLFTVSSNSDTRATQCYRYNTFTQAWTRWPITKTCGVINPSNDKLYLGAGDVGNIEIERKSFDRTDYADREVTKTITSVSYSGDNCVFMSVSGLAIGDNIVQTQRLTIGEFNILLQKLDNDPATGLSNNYLSTLQASAGNDLGTKLISLATKIDNDIGGGYLAGITAITNSDAYLQQQLRFNDIVDRLNLDADVVFSNYTQSSGTKTFEAIIRDVLSNCVAIDFDIPFITGDIIIHKGITSTIQWQPQFFENPAILKHVSEGIYIFENDRFSNSTASYSSDLDSSFEEIEFNGSSSGLWGQEVWSQFTWGGLGTEVPFRTYIPRNKQKCRFINCKLEHTAAYEEFFVLGLALVFRPISTRAYR